MIQSLEGDTSPLHIQKCHPWSGGPIQRIKAHNFNKLDIDNYPLLQIEIQLIRDIKYLIVKEFFLVNIKVIFVVLLLYFRYKIACSSLNWDTNYDRWT